MDTGGLGDAAPSLSMGLVQTGSGFLLGTLIDFFIPEIKPDPQTLNLWQELSIFILHVSISAVGFGVILGPILRSQGEFDPIGGSLAMISYFIAQPSLLARLGYLGKHVRENILRPFTG